MTEKLVSEVVDKVFDFDSKKSVYSCDWHA